MNHTSNRNPRTFAGIRVWLLLIAVALLLQQILLWWIYYHGGAKLLVGDEQQYFGSAQMILAGGPWHPSHIWPPGQALLIAATFAVFGVALWPVQLLQTLLFVGCGVLIWNLWRQLSGNLLAALLAALLFLLNPSDAAYAQYLWPEIPHLFLLLLLLNLLLPRVAQARSAFVAGAALGLALVFKSLLSAFWPLLLVCLVESWRPFRVRWVSVAAFLLGLVLTAAPAVIAGHRNTGHWAIADSSMFNLVAGLSDHLRNDYVDDPVGKLFGDYTASGTTTDQRNAWATTQVRERLSSEPLSSLLMQQLERQYFRLFESKTLLLTQLPGPACAGYLGAYHGTPPAMVNLLRGSSNLFHALMLIGFAFGLCLWREWRRFWLWLLLAFVGYQLALYLGLHVKARYLLPMVPIFCCFTGELFAACFTRSSSQLTLSPLRIVAGVALAAILMVLAFAGPWLDGYCVT